VSTGARWKALASVVATVAGAALSACEPTPTSNAVLLRFDGAPTPDGTPIDVATNHGTSSVRVTAVSLDGGRVVSASARPGASGRAVRLPRFDPTRPAPRAVLRIASTGSTDGLDARSGPIRFGADFVLDAASAQPGSAVDDGNNLVQRGLWDDPAQLKLEVDSGRLTCRVKGRSGEVTVISTTTVRPGTWHRAVCQRSGQRVTLTLGTWSSAGAFTARSWSEAGTTGSLSPSAASVPWSVGGKLRNDGAVHPATDQFNGSIDNVVLSLG
jgi:hypothetical protein